MSYPVRRRRPPRCIRQLESPEIRVAAPLLSRALYFPSASAGDLGARLGARREGKAVFHTGCHQRRELGLLREPRELLEGVEGLDLVGWPKEELCCGFGGTFSVKMPAVSTAMADEKIRALEGSGADTLISGDSSCLMHLGGRLRRTGHDTRVLHLAQVLDPTNGG